MVGRFRDSFQSGWREAHEQIEIESRASSSKEDLTQELLGMLSRFAVRGEQVWDDENFRDGYKKVSSGDLVDCRNLLRKFGITEFIEE